MHISLHRWRHAASFFATALNNRGLYFASISPSAVSAFWATPPSLSWLTPHPNIQASSSKFGGGKTDHGGYEDKCSLQRDNAGKVSLACRTMSSIAATPALNSCSCKVGRAQGRLWQISGCIEAGAPHAYNNKPWSQAAPLYASNATFPRIRVGKQLTSPSSKTAVISAHAGNSGEVTAAPRRSMQCLLKGVSSHHILDVSQLTAAAEKNTRLL